MWGTRKKPLITPSHESLAVHYIVLKLINEICPCFAAFHPARQWDTGILLHKGNISGIPRRNIYKARVAQSCTWNPGPSHVCRSRRHSLDHLQGEPFVVLFLPGVFFCFFLGGKNQDQCANERVILSMRLTTTNSDT